MFMTVLLVLVQLAILFVVGIAALAPVRPELRERLLPAAPVFGAVLIAVMSNWTCRWLSIRAALPVMAVVVIGLLVYGVRTGRRPFRVPRRALVNVGLAASVCLGGLAVAAVPAAVVDDTNAVSATYVVDQLYFGGVSTYITDHPILPGPTMTDSWEGNDPPATSPAADVVKNRLRFGQSAVAALTSVLLFRDPYGSLASISLLWLVLLALTAFVFATLLGVGRRWALLSAGLVSCSFYVVSQPLEGKNDGLLGASFALLAMALSANVVKDGRCRWPLMLVAAGLAATYSEYFLLLVPTITAFVVVGRRSELLHRANVIAGAWAASFLLAPWAWVWLAQSFKTTTRSTDGPNPFDGKSGWELFRTYLGLPSIQDAAIVNGLLSVAGVLLLVLLLAGLVAAAYRPEIRGLPVGLALIVVLLEVRAVTADAGNLQYRVLQLGLPGLIALAVAGWEYLWASRRLLARKRAALRWVTVAGAALFALGNLGAASASTSLDRARNQHVPVSFTAAMKDFVAEVGGADVAVVAPDLTDTSAISMALHDHPDVSFPVLARSTYLGAVPHWDRQPDKYVVVGRGATVVGDVTTVARVGDYRLVELGATGMVVAPFDLTDWPRISWMRGFPCAADHLQLVILRGGTGRATLNLAADAGTGGTRRDGLDVTAAGTSIDAKGPSRRIGDWTVRSVKVPQQWNSIISVERSRGLAATGPRTYPLVVGDGSLDASTLAAVDPALAEACATDPYDPQDGYDRELTLMRNAL